MIRHVGHLDIHEFCPPATEEFVLKPAISRQTEVSFACRKRNSNFAERTCAIHFNPFGSAAATPTSCSLQNPVEVCRKEGIVLFASTEQKLANF